MDTRLILYKNDRKLIAVDLRGRWAAKIEIDICKHRIRRGEATHMDIESLSEFGVSYIKELREYILL